MLADQIYFDKLDIEAGNNELFYDICEDVQLNFNKCYRKEFGTLDISFDNLRVHQVQDYINKGNSLLCDENIVSYDDIKGSTEEIYILFLMGFNELKMGESDINIELYIRRTLLLQEGTEVENKVIEHAREI